MKKRSNTRNHWFYKVRGSYLPASWQGWALYVPYTLFLYASLQYAVSNNDTVLGVVLAVFPQWVAAVVVMTWLATIRSK